MQLHNDIERCNTCGGGGGTRPKPKQAPRPAGNGGGVKLPKPWGR